MYTPKDEATDECSEGDVRLNRITDPDTLYRLNITGDVQGLINICENEVWRNVVLCGTDVTWNDSNTAVACRELRYAAAGQLMVYAIDYVVIHYQILTYAASFRVHDSQNVVTSRRLSYTPQCTGVENRLANCSHIDRDHENDDQNDHFPPVVISCWNSTADNSQSSATLTPSQPLASHTSDSSPSVTTTLIIDTPIPSQPVPTSSVPDESNSATSAIPTTFSSTVTLLTGMSSHTPSTPSRTNKGMPPPALYGAIGMGVVILLLVVGIAVVSVAVCCSRWRVKPRIVQDAPYEVPISLTGQRNQTFHEVELRTTHIPETEILYDSVRAAAAHPVLTEAALHTLETEHRPPQSPAAGSSPALSSSSADHSSHDTPPTPRPQYEEVLPASSRANRHRSPPKEKPPVYYHVLVDNSKSKPAMPHYHVLEEQQQQQSAASRGEPVYHKVFQRGAATLTVDSASLVQQHRRSLPPSLPGDHVTTLSPPPQHHSTARLSLPRQRRGSSETLI